MNFKTTNLATIVIISLLVFTMTASVCSAQEWSRKGKTELFGEIQQIGGEEVKYSMPNMLRRKLDIDNALMYGVGYGYNMTDHWNFNTNLLFGSADTDVKVVDTTAEKEDMDYVLFDLNLDYNFWKSRFTPLLTGGIGIMDFGIDTKTPDIGEVHESSFSYNLGVGIRWDIEDNILLKFMYRSIWTELDDANADLQYDNFSLSVAYMY